MKKIWTVITDYKIETGATIILICVIVFLMFTVHSCVKNIKEIGGLRHVIVESGKEIKLLTNDINKAYEEERNNP
jgi:hypothetical protein